MRYFIVVMALLALSIAGVNAQMLQSITNPVSAAAPAVVNIAWTDQGVQVRGATRIVWTDRGVDNE